MPVVASASVKPTGVEEGLLSVMSKVSLLSNEEADRTGERADNFAGAPSAGLLMDCPAKVRSFWSKGESLLGQPQIPQRRRVTR